MKGKHQIRKAAMELITDPRFFFHVGRKLEETGLVGEKRNALTVFLACLTRNLRKPVSVIIRGSTATGKLNLVRKVTTLFPGDCLMKRASLTEKALAYGEGALGGKILYLFEYRGGKDARYLTRLQQSEGEIAHEYTTVAGRKRERNVARREGSPVVLTTTTDKVVYPDDETRFLSLGADDSDELASGLENRSEFELTCNDLATNRESVGELRSVSY